MESKEIGSPAEHIDLIEQCKSGNAQAEFKLYSLYSKALYNSCIRIVQDRQIAEDLLQEVFVNIFSKINSYSTQYSFYTWAKRIAINHCINYQNRKRIDYQFTDDIGDQHIAQDDQVDEALMQYQLKSINKAMMLLPDGYREIFSLYLIEGYDHAEISEILKISESTSKSQFSRAKAKLKQLLKDIEYDQATI